jgi:hypothetical protein
MKFWYSRNAGRRKSYKERIVCYKGFPVLITIEEMRRHGLTTLRIGVCNYYRAVVGMINPQTDNFCSKTERHQEDYDDDDPLAYTIEVCANCHPKKQAKS